MGRRLWEARRGARRTCIGCCGGCYYYFIMGDRVSRLLTKTQWSCGVGGGGARAGGGGRE